MPLSAIQMLWVGERLSTLERLCVASFLANGHEVHLYTYGAVAGVPEGTRILDAREILPATSVFTYATGPGQGSPAAFANEFRYKLLLERGGVWSDTDVVCLRPLVFLESLPFAISSERLPQPHFAPGAILVNIGLIKAPAGFPFIARCHEAASAAKRGELTWGETGPRLATRLVGEMGLAKNVLKPETICPVDWWDLPAILDGPVPEGPAVYALHLWNEMWRRAGLDKDGRYAEAGAFEVLKRRYLPPS